MSLEKRIERVVREVLRKSLGSVGGEYAPPARDFENPNSYPGGFPEEEDGLLSHLNSGGMKNTVKPTMTKVYATALRQLGVKPRGVTEKRPAITPVNDRENFRR